jgi:hypothetical protein
MLIEQVRFYLQMPSPMSLSRGRVEMAWGTFPIKPCTEMPGNYYVEIDGIPDRPRHLQEVQGILRELADSSLPIRFVGSMPRDEFLALPPKPSA